jgi:hypothetical protein
MRDSNLDALAADLVDEIFDAVIRRLRQEKTLPRRTRHGWEQFFGDVRSRLAYDAADKLMRELPVDDHDDNDNDNDDDYNVVRDGGIELDHGH